MRVPGAGVARVRCGVQRGRAGGRRVALRPRRSGGSGRVAARHRDKDTARGRRRRATTADYGFYFVGEVRLLLKIV